MGTETQASPFDPADLQARLDKLRADTAALPDQESTAGRTMRSLGNGFGQIARAVGGGIKEAYTGDQRKTGDYPELTPLAVMQQPDGDFMKGMVSLLGSASADDPLGYANIMANWLPGAKVTFDANQNPLIKWEGKTYYANKPGFSGNDATRLATDMASYYPAARWAMTGKALLAKGIKGGAASAITNLVQQFGAQQLGSKEDLNLTTPAVAGMTGVASEILSPFIAKPAVDLWNRLGRGKLVDAKGGPTPFGRKFVEQVGLDPENVTAGMWEALDGYYVNMDKATKGIIKNALDAGQAVPEQAAQQARGAVSGALQSEPGGIPMTQGQATRDQAGLDFEEMARTGRIGQGARDTLSDFDRKQTQAVMGRADQLQSMAGGGQMTAQTPEGLGGVLAQGVQDREAQAWQGVGDAYDAVPGGVRLSADPLLSVGQGISTNLRAASIFPDRAGFEIVYPRTNKALNDIRGVMEEKAALPPSKRNFGLMELEQERRAVNQMMNGAEGSDMTGLTILKKTFDDRINKTWDDALIQGDQGALDQLKIARQVRTDYAKMFEPENVDKTVTNTIQKMVDQKDIDNNQVVNWIFGTTETGFGKAGLQMTRQLGRIFGKDSDEWNALREGAMMRIIYGTKSNAMNDATWNADKVISKSSGQLLRRLDNYLDNQGSMVMKDLFTKPELDQLRRFRYELRQIQPGENAQTLRTGASMALWLGKVGSWIDAAVRPMTGGVIKPSEMVSPVAKEMSGRAQAQAAVNGWPDLGPRSIPMFSALLTGAGTSGVPSAFGAAQDQQPPQ